MQKSNKRKRCYQFESGLNDGVRHEKHWREGIWEETWGDKAIIF